MMSSCWKVENHWVGGIRAADELLGVDTELRVMRFVETLMVGSRLQQAGASSSSSTARTLAAVERQQHCGWAAR